MRTIGKYPNFGLLLEGKVDAMSCSEIGACVLLAMYFWSNRDGSELLSDTAQRMLANRGIPRPEAVQILDMFRKLSLIDGDETTLRMPQIDEMIEAENVKRENRISGWDRRREAVSGATARSKAPAAKPDKKRASSSDRLEAEIDGGDTSPVVAEIVCKNGDKIKVTRAWIEGRSKAFTGIDLEREVLLAANWCFSNPAQRKSPAGIARFLNHWFSNAFDRNRMRGLIASTPPTKGSGFNSGNSNYSAPEAGNAGMQPHITSDLLGDDFPLANFMDTGDGEKPPAITSPAPTTGPSTNRIRIKRHSGSLPRETGGKQ